MQKIKRIVEVFDDLDDAEGISTPATESVTLGHNGFEVDIDLTAAHAQELAEKIDIYMRLGRRTSRSRRTAGMAMSQRATAIGRNRRVRDWANEDPNWKLDKWAPDWQYFPKALLDEYVEANPTEADSVAELEASRRGSSRDASRRASARRLG
jgi:hypothetical protein